MTVAINDIARFLGKYDPERLAALRSGFPEAAARFDPDGGPLGDAGDAAGGAAARAMLESVGGVADKAEADAMRRLAFSRWLELAGSLVAAFSSAGVVTALAVLSARNLAVTLAIIAFLGSAAPIVANWLKGTAGGAGTAAQALSRLRELVWEARKLQAGLPKAADVDKAVEQANDFAHQLSGVLNELGYRAAIRPV